MQKCEYDTLKKNKIKWNRVSKCLCIREFLWGVFFFNLKGIGDTAGFKLITGT